MTRYKWSLLVALMLGLVALGVSPRAACAQTGQPGTTDHSLQPVGANDMQGSTGTAFSWVGAWSMERFGTFTLRSWGRAPARSGSGRTSAAVLRERRGLLR